MQDNMSPFLDVDEINFCLGWEVRGCFITRPYAIHDIFTDRSRGSNSVSPILVFSGIFSEVP